jgi:threonylcarbamoyladenosine tRNA methylthiotransferase MtaB
MKRTFSLHTLGCKVNQYDSASIQAALEREDFQTGTGSSVPDVIVVNTCTVTSSTDRQNRQLIRKLRRTYPKALLVVTGCQAEVFPGTLEHMNEVDLVAGNSQKTHLPQLILDALAGRRPRPGDPAPVDPGWEHGVDHLPGHTRAFLKVQDGCEAFCTYCIVPRARGPSRSRPLSDILIEIERMAENEIQEVVLTGIHLGLYGRDLAPAISLVDLVEAILKHAPIPRIRLSSIEPLEIDDALIVIMRDSGRVCPHLHVPLQSGDDEVLARMNRPYRSLQYRESVTRASEMIPDLCLGGDIIVGFPGETEAHFERTLIFIADLPLAYLHVFPFSPRPGTPAYHFPDRIHASEVKLRSRQLRTLSMRFRLQYMTGFVGRDLPVLVERECA